MQKYFSQKMNRIESYPGLLNLVLVLVYVVPFIIVLRNVFSGSIPFWYDPARDLSLGLANLQKISLIGPPSGIPGIFYGPYWIWLLSGGLLISRDPKVVDFFVLTLPYFLFFPLVLLGFRKWFGLLAIVCVWLLFIFTYGHYAAFIWNPYVSPLLFLIFLYLFSTAGDTMKKQDIAKYFLAGFFAGLACNFHISFGLGLILGSYLFLFLSCGIRLLRDFSKKLLIATVVHVILYTMGVFLAFLPFFLFEVRHGFQQIHILQNAIFSPAPLVGLKGMSDMQIVEQFFGSFAKILHLPSLLAYFILGGLGCYLFYLVMKKKLTLEKQEKKLLFLVLCIAGTVLGVYLTAKNPVWDYHFINVEILFLVLILIFLKHIPIFRYLIILLLMWITLNQIVGFINSFRANPYETSSLATKEYVTNTIYTDSQKNPFAVYAYNPAIYTYDYDYLFTWLGEKHKNMPVASETTDTTYLIFPPNTSHEVKEDFINYRTPNAGYLSVKDWTIPDGTIIIKRQRSKDN